MFTRYKVCTLTYDRPLLCVLTRFSRMFAHMRCCSCNYRCYNTTNLYTSILLVIGTYHTKKNIYELVPILILRLERKKVSKSMTIDYGGVRHAPIHHIRRTAQQTSDSIKEATRVARTGVCVHRRPQCQQCSVRRWTTRAQAA